MDGEKIKILIVDDSRVTRDLIKYLLSINPHVEIIGTAENGIEALEIISRNCPDIVLTDIVMPKMDGFELTKKIMATNPMPVIVMSGVYSADEIKRSFDLIDAGAIAILEKPKGIADEQFADTAKFIFDTAKLLSSLRGFSKSKKNNNDSFVKFSVPLQMRLRNKNNPSFQIKALAIGSSVGGPKALKTILSTLHSAIGIPIFLVQHISAGFVQGFAEWLDESIPLKVTVAKNGETASPGQVYVAPDRFHMEVTPQGTIRLVDEEIERIYVPSIGRLFNSVAKSFGSNAMGILLLGAEKDGAKDLSEIKKRGGFTIQESSSTPNKELKQDLQSVDVIAPIEEISNIIKELLT